jgi:hypothetical protein
VCYSASQKYANQETRILTRSLLQIRLQRRQAPPILCKSTRDEPMFVSDWGPIVMLVHDLLSGKLMVDKLKTAPVAPGPLCMSPSLYGWVADGAPANAYKLAALWALVLCILEDDEAPPPEVSDWLRMFSIISVTHTRHASMSAKVGQIKKSQRN